MTLTNKEITLPRAIKIAKESNWDTSTKVIPSKNVKEAVLELKKNICYCDTNKFNEKICENCYFIRKIFGDYEEE